VPANQDPLTVMLEARSVALVGASPRPGSLGARMISEVAKSPRKPATYLVNPGHQAIGPDRVYPSLDALPEPVDLALLAVPDAALEEQVKACADATARSVVIFGSAFDSQQSPGLRGTIAAIAGSAGLPVCGAGCMGFVNVARGLRAIGYAEPDPLRKGPVALVTHSGSVFSALLRCRRAFGFSVAVSSGQELVTPAAAYARYALSLPETKVLALVLEAIRDGPALRAVLATAAERDVPVVLLTAGSSAKGRPLVAAHSGALAAGDGAWQALASAYGVHRVGDLAELADTLELLSAGRRAVGGGLATVHDSGFERAHVADVAASAGVEFAVISAATRRRLADVLDPGLEPANPLDVWGTGRSAGHVFTEALSALAADPGVGAVALAVDLVPEFDGDESYRDAVLAAAARTAKPVAVLASVPAAIDTAAAARLRDAGVPVLESTRSGLLALGHLLSRHAQRPPDAAPPLTPLPTAAPQPSLTPLPSPLDGDAAARRDRWAGRLTADPAALTGADLLGLLRDYGIPAARARPARTLDEALAAGGALGYPVALKTDEPGIAHKSDVGGVRLDIPSPAALAHAYTDFAARLGPRAIVCQMVAPGPELIIGMARDQALGPLIVTGHGGILANYYPERTVLLPPVTSAVAGAMISRLRFAEVLSGVRGSSPCDLAAVAAAVACFSVLVAELGDLLEAFDVNPLICGPSGVVAVDALAVTRAPA
jgi:acyl-CoA synthetase (NDP forming)